MKTDCIKPSLRTYPWLSCPEPLSQTWAIWHPQNFSEEDPTKAEAWRWTRAGERTLHEHRGWPRILIFFFFLVKLQKRSKNWTTSKQSLNSESIFQKSLNGAGCSKNPSRRTENESRGTVGCSPQGGTIFHLSSCLRSRHPQLTLCGAMPGAEGPHVPLVFQACGSRVLCAGSMLITMLLQTEKGKL